MENLNLYQGGRMPVYPTISFTQDHRQIIPAEQLRPVKVEEPVLVRNLPFIEANTKEASLGHLREDCIIPVFSKDNEVTISHQSFIETVFDAAVKVFPNETISEPAIRVSHIVKGRIPEAIHKPVSQLLESDKTIYYERMMFCIEIPTLWEDICGNRLYLTLGGVRAYNQENLYSRKTAEKFKVFIGFKNMVCCNLCIATDSYSSCVRAMEMSGLLQSCIDLFRCYDMERHLSMMRDFRQYGMSEAQFAQFLGKMRLYQYLPTKARKDLPAMQMTDTQIGLVAKNYYDDEDFGRGVDTCISMWKVYNLLTGANKSSYIDCFLERAQNASVITEGMCRALKGDAEYSWFIS